MKITYSSLTPSGWAVAILAGGCALSVPFFKRSVNDSEYSTVPSDNRALLQSPNASVSSNSRESQSSPYIQPKISTSMVTRDQTASAGAVANTELPRAVSVTVDSLPAPLKTGKQNEHSTVPATKVKGDQRIVEQPKKSPTAVTLDVGSVNELRPVATEFPDWAKKPSLLDALLSSNATEKSDNAQPPVAHKPSSFPTWTDKPHVQPSANAAQNDRYSPFGQNLDPYSSSISPSSATQPWPDEEPSALALVGPPQRVEGRDAIIRDAEAIEIANRASTKSPAKLSSTLESNWPGKLNRQNGMVVQPRFGEKALPENANSKHNEPATKPIGASLRSQVPPDENLLIQQPALRSK